MEAVFPEMVQAVRSLCEDHRDKAMKDDAERVENPAKGMFIAVLISVPIWLFACGAVAMVWWYFIK